MRAQFRILWIERRRLLERLPRLFLTILLLKIGGERLEIRNRARDVAERDPRPRAGHPCVEVVRIQRRQAHGDFRDAALVAARPPPLGDGVEERPRIGEQALAAGNLAGLEHRVLVIRLQLQDLLVDGRGFRQEAFAVKVLGDPGELFDGPVGLAGADVDIAESVGGVPVAGLILDDPQVLGDRLIELALSEQLFSVAQDGRTVDWHEDHSIVSNSVGGRNDRRCASE